MYLVTFLIAIPFQVYLVTAPSSQWHSLLPPYTVPTQERHMEGAMDCGQSSLEQGGQSSLFQVAFLDQSTTSLLKAKKTTPNLIYLVELFSVRLKTTYLMKITCKSP